ncbi:restriction endonuclease subunit S [Geomonas sp. RF6]|uniref:restriction endonuclease subunit S n=1 Tax=Geomonas sp. RF6 TaxID=2897342 RepID=UPI001E622C05|nr:restriction endonuclease subunit S [Geomonas sp. RF6]UFS72657.1 restriction endonuclease subunit S [Geomonas sp. RF6]
MIPKDWRKMRVDEIGSVQGGRQRSPHAKGILQRYLRVANVQDGFIDASDVLEMPFTEAEIERFHLKDGDILLNEGQSLELVGRSAMYRGNPPDCCYQNTLIRFQAGAHVDPEFAQHLFTYCRLSGHFQAIASRTTSIAHLGVERFASLVVPVPPVEEQKKISEVLETWYSAQKFLEEVITAKEVRRSWLIQQLVTGKRRLSSFQKPWQTVHLRDVFTNRMEPDHPDLPLVAITGENGVVSRDDLIRRDTSSEDKSRYLRICPGDIGYNTMRMWQGVCGLSQLEGIVSPAYTIVTPKDSVDGEFMALLFKSPTVVHMFHRHSQGLVDDTLNLKWRHFAEIKVTIPEKPEQQALAKVFRAVDQEITLLRDQLDALREQKKGLMQKLLTGKVRVKVSCR